MCSRGVIRNLRTEFATGTDDTGTAWTGTVAKPRRRIRMTR